MRLVDLAAAIARPRGLAVPSPHRRVAVPDRLSDQARTA